MASKQDEERRGHLREYILACVNNHILSWGDLARAEAYDRLLRVLSADFWVVVKEDLLPRAGMNLLGAAAVKLAEHVGSKKKSKRA